MTPRIPISLPSGPRNTNRHEPPTRKSPSQTASEKSRGPNQRLRLESARPPLRVAAARDEPRMLEHLEVLRDRRLTHCERLGQVHHARLARREPGENRPSRRVGQCGESHIESINAHDLYNLR